MQTYKVHGKRGTNRFHAPVEAESPDEAVETFLEQVTEEEWSELEAESIDG